MKNYHINSKQNGLTLIEILIAMVIGLFLLAGVMQIFLGSQRSYRLQENLSRMQENGRFAMDFITRDIRMTGAMGCVETANIKSTLITYPATDAKSVFNNFRESISNDLFPSNDTYDLNTNKLTLRSMLPTDIFVIPPSGSLTPKQIIELQKNTLSVNSITNLRNGDIIMVTNCDKGDIFKITSLTSNSIGHNDDKKPFQSDYGKNSQIYRANFVTYSIYTPPPINNEPQPVSLYRRVNGQTNKEALVENIEDMQILYGEDTNGDKTPNHYVSADRVTDMNNVISIRVSLLAVSPDDNLASNITPYTYNGVEITPTDTRLRQVITSTIAIRNRLP
jgi:type IV pilus assembly protein PilW